MESPEPPREHRRTCPTCNSPVKAYYNFCEACGAPMPKPPSCGSCGAVFPAPFLYCAVCGAPASVEEVPEAAGDRTGEAERDEVPEQSAEAGIVPVGDTTPSDTGEENQEPGTEDLPEHADEGDAERGEEDLPGRDDERIHELATREWPEQHHDQSTGAPAAKNPRHYSREIVEPDTEAIMEQFFDDREPDSGPGRRREQSQGTAPEEPGPASAKTVDDVLLFADKRPAAPVKPETRKLLLIGGAVVLILIAGMVIALIGLPVLTGSGGQGSRSTVDVTGFTPGPDSGSAPAILHTTVPTLTPASRAMVPKPTQGLPAGQKLFFQVMKNPVSAKISVIFAGSAGTGSISSAEITVTRPDGSVAAGIILPLKGVNEITLEGSQETDRVEIVARMSSGETYRVYDELLPALR